MRKILALALLLPVVAYAAPTVTLTAAPTSGASPLSVVLTWTSSGAANCTASGGWTGAKALSGSQTVTGITATTTFTLTCSEASGQATVSWTPPTTNTDGSTLVDLASYRLFHATTSAGLEASTPVTIAAPASSHTVFGLPAGTRFFGMKAVNSQGAMSAMSNVASKAIVIPSAVADATVTVNTVPNPPVIVTVSTLAYDLTRNGSIGRIVGNVPLGTGCLGGVYRIWKDGSTFYRIPSDAVTLTRPPRSTALYARCSAV